MLLPGTHTDLASAGWRLLAPASLGVRLCLLAFLLLGTVTSVAAQVRFGTPEDLPEPEAFSPTEAQGESPVESVPCAIVIPEMFSAAPLPGGRRISLGEALALAGLENPTIGLAESALQARLAEQLQAQTLLLPTLNVGGNLRVHRGNLLTAQGIIRDVDSQSLYAGLGADTKGGGTVAVPGIRVFSHLGEAIYAPQISRFRVFEARFTAAGVRNAVLLDVGAVYVELVGAQARVAALVDARQQLEEVARLTANFAKTGQGQDADAQRAGSELLLLEAEVQRLREEVGVAAAELARLLQLDPSVPLEGEDAIPPLLGLVDDRLPLADLLDFAQNQHPDIEARNAEVAAEQTRLRAEKVRPWLPTLSVGFSAGEFGGGSDATPDRFGNFAGRTDLDIYAVWSLQNLGAGNRAVQNRVGAEMAVAQAERLQTIARVRRQVSDAYYLTRTNRAKMELARKRVDHAQRAYRQDLTRVKNLQGRPIEVLNSINLLTAARQDLIRAMVAYSQAQLQLFAALGLSRQPK